jgi:hypothetical protein
MIASSKKLVVRQNEQILENRSLRPTCEITINQQLSELPLDAKCYVTQIADP